MALHFLRRQTGRTSSLRRHADVARGAAKWRCSASRHCRSRHRGSLLWLSWQSIPHCAIAWRKRSMAKIRRRSAHPGQPFVFRGRTPLGTAAVGQSLLSTSNISVLEVVFMGDRGAACSRQGEGLRLASSSGTNGLLPLLTCLSDPNHNRRPISDYACPTEFETELNYLKKECVGWWVRGAVGAWVSVFVCGESDICRCLVATISGVWDRWCRNAIQGRGCFCWSRHVNN